MDDKQFQILLAKLDSIIKLLAINTISGKKTLQDQVKLLYSFGFETKRIADILDKTPNHIHQILYTLRRKGLLR